MDIDWSLIDKVIYINLKERKDRNKSIKKELKALGVPLNKIFRLDAKRHLIGQIGCAQSHMEAMNLAIQEGWGNILVLEDDMIFNKDLASQIRLNNFLYALNNVEWDAALLSANYYKVIRFRSTDKLIKPLFALCACAYIVNGRYFPVIRDAFARSVELLLQGGHKYDYPVDVMWIPLMKRDCWFGMHPVAGHQAPGLSDIEERNMDYTAQFYKELSTISS
ncbi:glycosyltransferase family 25 protein [Enterobacter hormaechei]|uniref:glycosyltransferase family 25 protein n=1 Tax=Enterobacter hormaechei TaxID=158836 RepID=UPI00188C9114|nr:glycosyltransferase family 25 protein [Enterobacter hormaechei]MBF4167785.1 glycosyltransferase family 25 protein [Enterobacter hormaechei]